MWNEEEGKSDAHVPHGAADCMQPELAKRRAESSLNLTRFSRGMKGTTLKSLTTTPTYSGKPLQVQLLG